MAKVEKKRGLGRGLSALMSDVSLEQTREGVDAGNVAIDTLPIEMVHPNPDQPRKTFPEADMADLVSSVREKGIIQPLVVRKIDDQTYQLVAGERRWRAAQTANLHNVPVVVREFSDVEVLEIAIIENIQRADLNPMEEAAGYRQLMDKFGHTQEKLAEGLGKSRSHIANLMRLLQLPVGVQSLVETAELSAGHARALITADNAELLAKKIVAEGLSVRATEALVKKQSEHSEKKTSVNSNITEKDADTKALEGDLSAALGMKVVLDHKAGSEKGSLSIKYMTLEQLDELCQKLSS
ncbi:MAG: ParB/RepB/Spo0J family partition protein [Aliishimia sp.]